MYQRKKERLYVSKLLHDPVLTCPAFYTLSSGMCKNEFLHSAIIALHRYDFDHYSTPQSYEDIFKTFQSGAFPIYKEQYIVGFFGSKMMYLDMVGWHAMSVNMDIFKMENWLIC